MKIWIVLDKKIDVILSWKIELIDWVSLYKPIYKPSHLPQETNTF